MTFAVSLARRWYLALWWPEGWFRRPRFFRGRASAVLYNLRLPTDEQVAP